PGEPSSYCSLPRYSGGGRGWGRACLTARTAGEDTGGTQMLTLNLHHRPHRPRLLNFYVPNLTGKRDIPAAANLRIRLVFSHQDQPASLRHHPARLAAYSDRLYERRPAARDFDGRGTIAYFD